MTGTQSGPGSRARRYRELLLHAGSFALTLAIIGTGLLWALPSVSVGYSACSFGAVWSISVALSLNVVYHFWLTAWSDPGRIPTLSRTTWAKLVAPLAAKPSHIESLLPCLLRQPVSYACRSIRCGTCILKLDHHCAFMHNCVGAGNVTYMARFLTSIVAGTGYVAVYALLLALPTLLSTASGFARSIANVHDPVDLAQLLFDSNPLFVLPKGAAFLVGTRLGGICILGAVSTVVCCCAALLSSNILRATAEGETNLERSARINRSGADYRDQHQRVLQRLFLGSRTLSVSDHAAEVARLIGGGRRGDDSAGHASVRMRAPGFAQLET